MSVPPETRRKPCVQQSLRQSGGVFDHLLGVLLERRLQRLTEAHGLGGDDVLQGAALGAGEYGGVDLLVNGRRRCREIRPPRGPRRVLWVVEVTTSA